MDWVHLLGWLGWMFMTREFFFIVVIVVVSILQGNRPRSMFETVPGQAVGRERRIGSWS